MIDMTNEELDDAVLAAIREAPSVTAAKIRALLLLGPKSDRDMDRSLQRLRKRNLIEYGGRGTTFFGWRVVA